MLEKEIKEKILKIMELSLEISNQKKYQVFAWYSGSIDGLEIFVKEKERNEFFFKKTVYLDWEEKYVLVGLNEVIKKLEELKK